MNAPSGFTFQSESFAMNRRRRRVMHPTTNVSRFERWIGATTYEPDCGSFSVPSYDTRNQILQNVMTTVRANW
ncbi:MAG TPA: hypothetical protein VK461_01335 [Acidimicrobiales bacterium]|nr:hypothetical protein [Acidimicrobiales bacterium]